MAGRRARRTWRLLDGFGQWVAFDSAGNAVAYGPDIPSRKFDMAGGKNESYPAANALLDRLIKEHR